MAARAESEMIQDSLVSDNCKIYRDVFVSGSKIGDSALLDRSTILYSQLGDKTQIGRGSILIHASMGFGSYVGADSVVKFSKIGKFSNLSWQLSIGGSNHNYKSACMYTDSWWKKTFNVGAGLGTVCEEDFTTIGNDVWIGAQANILRGVNIGDGAVVGANSLVLQDIPPYGIAVGSPAKVIKKRFDDDTIKRLLEIKWWDWEPEKIASCHDLLHGDLSEAKLRQLEVLSRD